MWVKEYTRSGLPGSFAFSSQLFRFVCVRACACVRACVRACVSPRHACRGEPPFLLGFFSATWGGSPWWRRGLHQKTDLHTHLSHHHAYAAALISPLPPRPLRWCNRNAPVNCDSAGEGGGGGTDNCACQPTPTIRGLAGVGGALPPPSSGALRKPGDPSLRGARRQLSQILPQSRRCTLQARRSPAPPPLLFFFSLFSLSDENEEKGKEQQPRQQHSAGPPFPSDVTLRVKRSPSRPQGKHTSITPG